MSPRLDQVSLYESEIERLATRHARLEWRLIDAVALADIARRPRQVAERLAREIPEGGYTFRPLIPRKARLNGKDRTIYRLDALDAVVWSALVRVLTTAFDARLGSHLFSYRKGYSQWRAAAAFLDYVHAHERQRPDPRHRGLFVLRRDVRRYDETIPVLDDSSLWTTLDRLCDGNSFGYRADFTMFMRRAFRPEVAQADGVVRRFELGVPTGMPTQTIACNTYLLPVDAKILEIEGGFYARFGDDILFAHSDLERAQHAARVFDDELGRLKLTFNPDKSQAFYLTRPGRHHPSATHFTPVSRLAYLGFDVGFAGAQLRADKRRAMWLALSRRIDAAQRMVADQKLEVRALALCQTLRTALDPGSPLSERYAPWLRHAVSSRLDLAQLDHDLALLVAQRLTRTRGIRAFRQFPPQLLRERYGLPSLIHNFNLARRAARSEA
jgi:hypothetical protein